jgi:hypothetical protein
VQRRIQKLLGTSSLPTRKHEECIVIDALAFADRLQPKSLLELRKAFQRLEIKQQSTGKSQQQAKKGGDRYEQVAAEPGVSVVDFLVTLIDHLFDEKTSADTRHLWMVDLVFLYDLVDLDSNGRVEWTKFVDFIVRNAAGGSKSGSGSTSQANGR